MAGFGSVTLDDEGVPAEIDTSKPHPARVYDYFLGGKDNFAADREAATKALQVLPTVRTAARENRAFLGRAVRYLAAGAGITQFLDLGSGLPNVGNVHDVAQDVQPSARVVYVDNDPIVLAHARALLTCKPEGKCAYIQADIREPESILSHPITQETLDFSQPIALILAAVLHFFPDDEQAHGIVETLVAALPPGSYLAASHGTEEYAQQNGSGLPGVYQREGMSLVARTAREFADLAFTGLILVPPGMIVASEWRPDADLSVRPPAAEVGVNGAVARKP